jgi:hypothetical protein
MTVSEPQWPQTDGETVSRLFVVTDLPPGASTLNIAGVPDINDEWRPRKDGPVYDVVGRSTHSSHSDRTGTVMVTVHYRSRGNPASGL